MPRELKILEANLNRCRGAHDMVLSTASAKDADIIAVGEPNKGIVGIGRLA